MVNPSGDSVIRESLERFMTGRELIQLTSTGMDSATIDRRTRDLNNRPFDLFAFNCEHFVNGVVSDRLVSPQLYHGFLLVVVLFWAKNRKQ